MPALKDRRHELLAQSLAKGASLAEASKAAGYRGDRSNADKIAKRPEVLARIVELQAKAADLTVVTIESIAAQLDEERALAIKLEQPSAATTATMGKAKLYGLITEKHKHQVGLSYEDALAELDKPQ